MVSAPTIDGKPHGIRRHSRIDPDHRIDVRADPRPIHLRTPRVIPVKGKGDMDTYILVGRVTDLTPPTARS